MQFIMVIVLGLSVPFPEGSGTLSRRRQRPLRVADQGGSFPSQKAADVWKKDVWDFQAFSQTFLEVRFSLGNEGKDGKNLNSQTWPGTPRRPSPRHPRPPDLGNDLPTGCTVQCICNTQELIFWEVDLDSNFSVFAVRRLLNGPDLFTELPFLWKSLPNPSFTKCLPPFH